MPPVELNAPALVTVAGGIILAVLGLRWIWKPITSHEATGTMFVHLQVRGMHGAEPAPQSFRTLPIAAQPQELMLSATAKFQLIRSPGARRMNSIRRTDQLDIVGKGLSGMNSRCPSATDWAWGMNSR